MFGENGWILANFFFANIQPSSPHKFARSIRDLQYDNPVQGSEIVVKSRPVKEMRKTRGGLGRDLSQVARVSFSLCSFQYVPTILSESLAQAIIRPKRELFLSGLTREIPSGQDGPILLTRLANQNARFACPLVDPSV